MSFAKECYTLGLLHARNARELVAFVLRFYHLAYHMLMGLFVHMERINLPESTRLNQTSDVLHWEKK